MKRIGLKLSTTLTFALLAVLAMAYPAHTLAQGGASIHGHVINAAGMPVNKGEVRLSQDRTATNAKDRKYLYTFPLDQNGDYKGSGITPGSYIVFVFQNEISMDFLDNVAFTNGEDKVVNFDMTRAEYIAKMSPEDKKALEEYKKKNAEIVAGNTKIQPISVGNVAKAFVAAVRNDASISKTYELCGPDPFTWNELYDELQKILGTRKPTLHLPLPIARVQAALFERILTNPPFTRDQLLMLQEDNAGDPKPAEREFLLQQENFEEGVAGYLNPAV